MSAAHAPGELRAQVLGDLSRNPLTTLAGIASRLDGGDAANTRNVLRITLGRMADRGWVRRHGDGYMLTRSGIDHLSRLRRWIAP